MPDRHRSRPNAALAILLGVSLALSTTSYSRAQTDPDELARRHFESGAAYFEQAEYDAALREFQKAYELSRRPQILRNISVVQERMGDVAGAVASLDAYLEAAPNDPDIETIRIRRDNLRKRLEQEAPPEPTQAPPTAQTEPEPKPPARPPPPDDANDEPPPPEEEPNLVPAYVLITIGALAGAGSGVTGFLASEEHSRLESDCGAVGCSGDATAKGETLALTSTVLTGVAVLGVGIGVILWATAGSGSEQASSAVPRVSLGVGAQGGFGEARWQF